MCNALGRVITPLAVPDSLRGQLAFIRERWAALLGDFLDRLLLGLDVLAKRQMLGFVKELNRERGVTVRSFPSSRRLVTAAVRAGRRIQPMHGLFEVDITTARQLLADHDPPLSPSPIHISEPTTLLSISYADFCLKKKTNKTH